MRSGKLWLFILVVGGVLFARTYFERPTSPDAPADMPRAADPAAPAGPYALDTTRAGWPPLDDAAPEPQAENLAAVNYYVVLDGSGSMHKSQCSGGRSKIEAAIAALNDFVAHVPQEHYLGLAVFDANGLSERVPLGAGNRVRMTDALARVRADGGTPLHSAISLGFEKLTRQGRRQLGYGEYHLVVVTDGHPDPDSEDPTHIVNRLLQESPVLLHTVGFCIGESHVLNQPGRVFYAAADSPEQLRKGLEAVLAEAPSFDVARFRQ